MRWPAVVVVAGVACCAPAEAQRQPGWEVRVPERIEVAAGSSATVAVAIAVDRGLVVSKDAPVIVDLALDPPISVKRKRLGRGDAVDPEADAPRFAIPVRAATDAAIGERALQIRLRLWVCGGKVCRPVDERRRVAIVVTPAPVAGPGG